MFLAHLSTEHFYFDALGGTEDEALKTMRHGLRQHAHDRDIPTDWWKDYEDGINTFQIEPGQVILDQSRVLYGPLAAGHR